MDHVIHVESKLKRCRLQLTMLAVVVVGTVGYVAMSTKVGDAPPRLMSSLVPETIATESPSPLLHGDLPTTTPSSPLLVVDNQTVITPPPLTIHQGRSSICMGMRAAPEMGFVFTTNAERVRALSTAAATHVGGYVQLPPQGLWRGESLDFKGLTGALQRPECEWVVLVGLHVILVPSATDLLTSLLANAKGDVVAFHSATNTNRIDFRVLALRANKGRRDLTDVTTMAGFEQRLHETTGVSVASIATVLKMEPNDSVRLPFEVAGIQRSAAVCKSLVLDVFRTFTPSTMPVPCSGMSAEQCWSGSCENSGDIYFPASKNANVCIIHSKGDGRKTKFMGPLNVLSWDYYVALHGYKMHSYEPKGRDGHLYDGHRTKLNELIVSLQDPDCSWVMWSDDDTIVVNFNITLESIVTEFAVLPGTTVIGPWDHASNVVNSGNFFIRRNTEGARFAMRFRRWMSLGFVAPRLWKDNTDFIHLIETSEFSPITVIAPQDRFNAYFTTKVHELGYNSYNPQLSLLIHYPGAMSDLRAIPSCSLFPPHANTLLNSRNYGFCGQRSISACFEHYCRTGGFKEVSPPRGDSNKTEVCVVTPPEACSTLKHSFVVDTHTCPSCRYVAAPADTPCDGTLPAGRMSELTQQCSWVVYPLGPCLSLDLVKAKLTSNTASVVMGRGEDSKVAVGFVAVRGDMWGNMYVRHVENFHTLQLATPAIEDPREVIQYVGTSRQFLARLDRIPLSVVCPSK